jgi:hypothetical protein
VDAAGLHAQEGGGLEECLGASEPGLAIKSPPKKTHPKKTLKMYFFGFFGLVWFFCPPQATDEPARNEMQ